MLALLNFSENAIQFGEKTVTLNSELLSNNYHNIMTEEIISNHEPPHPQKKKLTFPTTQKVDLCGHDRTNVRNLISVYLGFHLLRFFFLSQKVLSVQVLPVPATFSQIFFSTWPAFISDLLAFLLAPGAGQSHQIRGDLGNGIHLTGPSGTHTHTPA